MGQALFHFDLSENYPIVPQDEIQSGHWDHTSCTLLTAIVHFKDTKDNLLKNKPFIIVSDYATTNMLCQSFLTEFLMSFQNLSLI